jgi:von Willebrand factor type D domain
MFSIRRTRPFSLAVVLSLAASSPVAVAVTPPASAAPAVSRPAVSEACLAAEQAYQEALAFLHEQQGKLEQAQQAERANQAEIQELESEIADLKQQSTDLSRAINDDNVLVGNYLNQVRRFLLDALHDLGFTKTQDVVIEKSVAEIDEAVAQRILAEVSFQSSLYQQAAILDRTAWAAAAQAFYRLRAAPALLVVALLPASILLGKIGIALIALAYHNHEMSVVAMKLKAAEEKLATDQAQQADLASRAELLQDLVDDAQEAVQAAWQHVISACGRTEPGGSTGTTWGDPHLVTFDEATYNFQQVGEFILAKSDRDDFEIQVRQRPWESTSTSVAENSAVAFSIGGHRMSIYAENPGVQTLVDGTAVTLTSDVPYPLPGGGTVTDEAWAGNEIVSWPDGAYVIVDYSGGHYLTLDVSVPAAERGHLSGLLGNDDGNPDNDITTRGGKTLPYPPTIKQLYGAFSNSWRIRQSESLFTYAPGTSTKTFTNKDFPYQIVTNGTLPGQEVQSGTAECEAAGVTSQPYLNGCVLDVSVTGDPGTATAAGGAQGFMNQTQGTLTLAPGTAGPDVVGTMQSLQVTATTTAGQPIANTPVSLQVTGANPGTLHATTDQNGTASFSYTGTAAGTDSAVASLQVGQIVLSSAASTVYWVSPQAVTSTTEVHGTYFANPNDTGDFEAVPGDTPAFKQVTPTIDFNPPSGAVGNPPPGFSVSPSSRPFTNVTLDDTGSYTGTIVAQGTGPSGTLEQAGVNDLYAFYAEYTGSLVVAQPGDLTFDFYSDDGFVAGIGGGASYVSGIYVNPPPSGVTAFKGYPVVASYNQSSPPTGNTATINFPHAGVYPFELDYTECCGGTLAMTVTNPNGLGIPPAGNLALSPPTPGPDSTGTSQAFTVTAVDASGDLLTSLPVTLTVTGANPKVLHAKTSSNGVARFSYDGANAGTDQIQATASITGGPEISNIASLTWTTPASVRLHPRQ